MRHWLTLGFVLAVPVARAAPQQVPTPANVQQLAPVTVSGVMPGPGLWKVSQGDHVLWLLGTLSPLPGNMRWESHEVAQVLAHSQQVLLEPSITVKADVGFFGKLFLLPSAYSARKNPDGKTLDQVMDAPTYARWQALKVKYLGHDESVERWRPLFAGEALYKKALKANGLSRNGGVQGAVEALAKRDGVPVAAVDYRVEIAHPRDALKAFKAAAPSDLACFSRTLDALEHDLPAMTARANAWATGDLDTLRQLPDSQRHAACVQALARAGFAQQVGLADVPARLRASWLDAARKALAANASSFALLPMHELLAPDGYLAALRAQGYVVQSPDSDDDTPASAASSAPPATH